MNQRYLQAYQAAAATRSQRDQDAEVFQGVVRGLRAAATELERVRALADARRLWQTVLVACRDDTNPLPKPLRAQIVSVAEAVTQNLASPDPDLDFVVEVTEAIGYGLAGRSGPASAASSMLPPDPERLSCPA